MIDFFKKNKKSVDELSIYKTIFSSLHDAMLIMSEDGKVLDVNNKGEHLFGGDAPLHLDRKSFKLVNNEIYSLNDLVETFKNRGEFGDFIVDTKLLLKNQETPLKITFSKIKHADQSSISIIFEDLTQELSLKNLSYHDLLTNLPNQQQAFLDISIAINKARFKERQFALLLLAIDDFIKLRAHLGYKVVNDLVTAISKNLQYLAEEIDATVYHITRNNYLLLIPDISSEEEIESIHQKITTDLNRLIKNLDVTNLTFSMGVTLFPQGGEGVELLIDNTYKALHEAKKSGQGKVAFDKGITVDSEMVDELELLNEMKFGLDNNQFLVYYQPLIDMTTGKISGAEALVRWNHPKRGFISPASFIPLAKKSGFIVQLGKFIIHQAIKQQKQWELFDFRDIEIAIKITLREIETGGLVEFIEEQFFEYSIRPELIRFEIPENVAMINTGIAKREFELLKRLGVSLSLDNFGMGLSSLAYLRELPLDTLKINYSFVLDILNNKEHQKIVKAIITLGHNFDLKVVVSGIESREIYTFLKSYGCDIAQGFYLSEPCPAFEFQEMIRDNVSLLDYSKKSKNDDEDEMSIDDYFDLYSEKSNKISREFNGKGYTYK